MKVTAEPQSGKIQLENQNEEKGFCTFTTRYSTSNPMDKEIVIKEPKFPNQELNQYLRTKVAEKEPCTIPKQDGPSNSLDKINVIKEAEVSNLAWNQYLKEKAKHNLQASLRWKVFLFPPFPKSTPLAKSSRLYFGLDLVDQQKEVTNWCHKPTTWKDLFTGL